MIKYLIVLKKVLHKILTPIRGTTKGIDLKNDIFTVGYRIYIWDSVPRHHNQMAYCLRGRPLIFLEIPTILINSGCYTKVLHQVTDGGDQNALSFLPCPKSIFLLFQTPRPCRSSNLRRQKRVAVFAADRIFV